MFKGFILVFFLPASWEKSVELSEDLMVEWRVQEETAVISVKVLLGHQDWIAVGFSDYGSLPESDLCIFWRNWKNVVGFEGGFVRGDGLVEVEQENECNNMRWRLVKSEEGDGKEILEYIYSRPLVSCSSHGYSIEDGTTHIVWALGKGPLYRLDGLNVSSSVNVRTGMTRTRFIDSELLPEGGVDDEHDHHHHHQQQQPLVVRHQNVSLQEGEDTLYWCSVHKLPHQFRRKHHVTEYAPHIVPGNEGVVHHMEVFHCTGEKEFPIWEGSCGDKDAPDKLKKCKKVLAAWAIGAGPFTYPKEAGLAIGGEDFNPYLMLEVHYNNQAKVGGILDSSGIKFQVTSTLRQYDAGIMELGLIYNDWMAVPPGLSSFSLSGSCLAECTAVGIPTDGIVMFGSQLHTHGAGLKVQTTRVREGQEEVVNIDPHYSTHFQEIRLLRNPAKILPGDALITTCLYNTEERQNITLGGFGFSEEMCVNYVHYYPRISLEVCKSSVDREDLFNYFESLKEEESQDTDAEKSIAENYRSIRWNIKRSRDLNTLYTKKNIAMQCFNGKGEELPGTWTGLPQTRISHPFTYRPPCENQAAKSKPQNYYANAIKQYNQHLAQSKSMSEEELEKKSVDLKQKKNDIEDPSMDSNIDRVFIKRDLPAHVHMPGMSPIGGMHHHEGHKRGKQEEEKEEEEEDRENMKRKRMPMFTDQKDEKRNRFNRIIKKGGDRHRRTSTIERRAKKFQLNRYADTWPEYDSWGFDKRSSFYEGDRSDDIEIDEDEVDDDERAGTERLDYGKDESSDFKRKRMLGSM